MGRARALKGQKSLGARTGLTWKEEGSMGPGRSRYRDGERVAGSRREGGSSFAEDVLV